MRFSLRTYVAAASLLLPTMILAPRVDAQRKAAAPTAAAAVDSSKYTPLTWRYIGPEGNRVTSTSGVPGDPNTYYAGAASGGLWKTTDAGITWKPLFDGEPVSSIGSVAVASSDHNVVWVGTGEPFIRSHISLGWGVFKSTDAGKNWQKMGLENTGRISRIVIHPTNPEVVYVAALGHAYGPQPDRGIFRTTDGGKTWEKVLFVNDSTGAVDLVMDPNNPRILYAAFWQVELHTWGRLSGGAGSGIWMSRDGGTTWKRLQGNGLPTATIGKIGLGISKANSDRIYALIETGDGVPAVNVAAPATGRLWRSDDGGANWKKVSDDRQLAGRTAYYNRMGVSPDNADEAYFLSANWAKTLDGGQTVIDPPDVEIPGGDHHDIWIDPTNGNRMAVSHDGGLAVTTNRGKSWRNFELPIAQIYHVTTDDRIPYYVYGNRQDGPSARGPSNTRYGANGAFPDIPRGAWQTVGGGESGFATPDASDTNFVWSSASGSGAGGGIVTRYDLRSGAVRYVEVWPEGTIGHSAAEVKYRFVWNFPLHVSPNDPKKVYVGSQHVHVSRDYGQSWQLYSPDLTRNDRSKMQRSGGLTPDNIGVEYSGVVMWIAESPIEPGVVWAGTNDGKLQLTRDDGKSWTDVSANLAGLPDWGTVSSIVPSRFTKGVAYASVDGHQANNRDPWIWRTADYGKTWTLIVNGIPKSPLSYVHALAEDPVKPGLLFAGAENGMYVSFDDGARWQPLQNNLPHAPVYGITVQPRFSDLVIATYGRGFWILDDMTPLRTAVDVAPQDVALFAPRNAWRFRTAEAPFAVGNDPTAGFSPKYGASIDFWLKSDAKDSLKVEILDGTGAVVRSLTTAGKAGINRVWWDLRGESTREARIRVSPYLSPWMKVEASGKPAPGVGRMSLLLPAGTYTVRLAAVGKTLTQPLVVLADPNSHASPDALKAQETLARAIMSDIDSTVATIDRVELARSQLVAAKAALTSGEKDAAKDKDADLRAAADSLDERIAGLEEKLFQIRVTGRGQDALRWPQGIAEKLEYLGGTLTASDDRPTDSEREVQALLRQRLHEAQAAIDALLKGDFDAFKKRVRDRNVNIVF
ncbi:MAG: sialidase [Gemmatimonadetes bacterium]|nr:sialidase [Gemmatimonadota bacterium]